MSRKTTKTTRVRRNGVLVKVTRFFDELGCSGSTVEADCSCMGYNRAHSRMGCPNNASPPPAGVGRKAGGQT